LIRPDDAARAQRRDHQADRGADRGLALVVVREEELGLGRVGLVPVDGVFELAQPLQ
jgi:hypothetical protein